MKVRILYNHQIGWSSLTNKGEFGIVYKAVLNNWRGYQHLLVAVKTLKGRHFARMDTK